MAHFLRICILTQTFAMFAEGINTHKDSQSIRTVFECSYEPEILCNSIASVSRSGDFA